MMVLEINHLFFWRYTMNAQNIFGYSTKARLDNRNHRLLNTVYAAHNYTGAPRTSKTDRTRKSDPSGK